MSLGELPGVQKGFDELVRDVFGSRPTRAMIEIADRCNESCVHCYQVQGQKGEMESGDIFSILDDLAKAGILFLTLSGGEATLRSDFLDIVRYARRLDFAITLFTNGLRITEEMAEELAGIGLRRVDISIYSVDPDTHDWTTNVPGSWERSTAAVKHLTTRGVMVKIKTPLMATNSGMWAAYQRLAERLGAVAVMDPALKAREDGARHPERLRGDDDAIKSLIPELDLLPRDPQEDLSQRKICGAAENIHIEPNGELRPCALLDLSLGDARSDGVAALQANPIAETLRGLRWADLPGCRVCDIANHCSRCHAQALREVGDALAPYPDACHTAKLRWELATGGALSGGLESRDCLGPFADAGGRLVARRTPTRTAELEALYESQPWLRRRAQRAEPFVRPGQLVKLRRPGRPQKAERVPQQAESRARVPADE